MSSSRNSSLTNNESQSIFSTITPSMSPSITPSVSVNKSPSLLESIGNSVSNATNSVVNTTSGVINSVNPFKSKEPTLIESTDNVVSDTTNSIVDTTSNVISSINPFKSKEPTILENIENTAYDATTAVKETFSPKTTNTPITPPNNVIYRIFRITLMIILICILALNAILFLNERTDIFTKYLGIPILKTTSTAKGTVNKANEGSKFILDVIKDSINDLFSLPEMAIKQFINGDNNTGKYCYIGKDQDKRVCVEIDDKDVCESNKIFPTMDVCINPNLK